MLSARMTSGPASRRLAASEEAKRSSAPPTAPALTNAISGTTGGSNGGPSVIALHEKKALKFEDDRTD
eukprot:scaffold329187_cov53-Tisochrysis_lutea.AAC.2